MRMIEASTPQRKGRGEEVGGRREGVYHRLHDQCMLVAKQHAETQGNDESDTLHRVGLCTPQGTWGRGWLRETGVPYSRSK